MKRGLLDYTTLKVGNNTVNSREGKYWQIANQRFMVAWNEM